MTSRSGGARGSASCRAGRSRLSGPERSARHWAWSAGDRTRRAAAAELAAELAPAGTARATYPRLAAGSAASRYVGDEALRLFRMAADAAVPAGDRAGAARDLATMAMYVNRAPGIMGSVHSRAEADALVAEACSRSDGSLPVQAALALADFGYRPAIGEARCGSPRRR